MRPEERLPYTAAIDRKRPSLPGAKAVAVWPVVNVETWLIDNPMPRQVLVAPTAAVLQPDLPNWAWHEYGMRIGFWRFLEAFASRGIRPTLSINGLVCERYPRIASAAREAGWEFMGHGYVQVPIHREPDQRAMIHKALDTIERHTGERPVGWLGPGLTETLETPDLLAEAGIRYIADWVLDDLPCRLATAHGPVVTMPYSVESNDIPMLAIQHRTAAAFADQVLAQTARLAAEAVSGGPLGGAKVSSFAIHPYLMGVAHRIGELERLLDTLLARPDVAFVQGREILEWYLASDDPT